MKSVFAKILIKLQLGCVLKKGDCIRKGFGTVKYLKRKKITYEKIWIHAYKRMVQRINVTVVCNGVL